MWAFRVVLWLHILMAISWVGGVLFVGWGGFFAFRRFPMETQYRLIRDLMKHAHIVFTALGVGVIVTGVLLGTWLGPVHSMTDVFSSKFGELWATALVAGVLTLAWATFVSYPHAMRVLAADAGKRSAGDTRLWIDRGLLSIALVECGEVVGFLILLSCMILFIS